jgi:flavin reductase (DIM6/NTAB) family NADH-FMN oxidoreductase RutF
MLKPIDLKQVTLDPVTMIGKEWMLISAGSEEKYNMMTASWGGIGVMWSKNVTNIVLRPQRYTLEFVDRSDYYALSFFGDNYRSALNYCGAHSGRDVDKEKETGLTPVFDAEAPYFAEARLVLICRKLYKQRITPDGFFDPALATQNYPEEDYHDYIIGEIVKVLKAD